MAKTWNYMVVLLVSGLVANVAAAGHCGSVNHGCCPDAPKADRPLYNITYRKECKTCYKLVPQKVKEKVWRTCYKDVTETVMRSVPRTEMREVSETQMRSVTRTDYRRVSETQYRTENYTVDIPVQETQYRDETYTVDIPVQETQYRDETYTVDTPVQETQWRDVTYTVTRQVNETVMREETYEEVVPRRTYRTVNRESVQEGTLREFLPGRTMTRQEATSGGANIRDNDAPGTVGGLGNGMPYVAGSSAAGEGGRVYTDHDGNVGGLLGEMRLGHKAPCNTCAPAKACENCTIQEGNCELPGVWICRPIICRRTIVCQIPYCVMERHVRTRQVPVTVTKCVQDPCTKKVPYCVTKIVTETRSRKVPYCVTKILKETRCRKVPYCVTKILKETRCRKVPYCVTKLVPVEVCEKVPVCVKKCVPVQVCEKVPVCVTKRVPVKVCEEVCKTVYKRVPHQVCVSIPEIHCADEGCPAPACGAPAKSHLGGLLNLFGRRSEPACAEEIVVDRTYVPSHARMAAPTHVGEHAPVLEQVPTVEKRSGLMLEKAPDVAPVMPELKDKEAPAVK